MKNNVKIMAMELLQKGHGFFYGNDLNYSAAEEEYKRVISIAPEWGEGYFYLGASLLAQGKYDEAIIASRKALSIMAEDPRPLVVMVKAFIAKNDFGSAIENARKALNLDIKYGRADVLLLLAEAQELSGDIASAIQNWKDVLTIEASYPSHQETFVVANNKLRRHGINDAAVPLLHRE